MSAGIDVLVQTGAYGFVIFGGILLINFLTRGFLIAYLSTKGSRGKKVLLCIRTLTGRYYRAGKLVDNTIKYKSIGKLSQKITHIPEGALYNSLGVFCMDYDENKNAVIDQISTEAVDGHDANKVDDMIEKALSKPAMVDKSNIIIIILCILILIGVIVVLVKTFQLDKTINSLQIIGKV